MKDLADHIGTILWITSGLLSICGVLIGLIWNDLRKTVVQLKIGTEKFPEWLMIQGQKGGVVNRDDFFCFCDEVRAKCQIIDLCNWRNDISEKGGPMTKSDHLVLSKDLSNIAQLASSVAEKSDHQRELVMKELQVIQLQIEKDVVSEIRKLKEELRRNGK